MSIQLGDPHSHVEVDGTAYIAQLLPTPLALRSKRFQVVEMY